MFEHSLVELEKRPRTSRRWLSFPVAVFVHLGAFVAVSFASYWSVGDVKEPDLIDPFVIAVQLPETKQAAPPAERPRSQPASGRPSAPPPAVVQPNPVIPDTIPNVADLPTAPALDAPIAKDPGPLTYGDGTDPNAKGDGKGSGDGPVANEDGPRIITGGITPPVVASRVEPRYTELARKAGLQGVVIVEAIIDEDGRVTNVRVLRGLPLGLEEAAVAAVKQWRFKPALMESRPVKVYYNLTINFRLMH